VTRTPETPLQLWLADIINAGATVILVSILALALWALTPEGWSTINHWLVR
jgi:hypothetical protein